MEEIIKDINGNEVDLSEFENGKGDEEVVFNKMKSYNGKSWISGSVSAFSNSPLVDYVCLSPNCNKPRNRMIDTITIHCLPVASTEVLTKTGWVNLGEVSVGDEIATSDEYCNIKFDKVLEKVPVRQEEVYNFATGISATKQHRMLLKKQYELNPEKPFRDGIIDDVLKSASCFYFPNSGTYDAPGLPLTNDEINFLCAIQADGSYEKDDKGHVSSVYLRLWRERKIAQADEMLTNLGYFHNRRRTHRDIGIGDGIRFRINDKKALELCQKYMTDKVFNFSLLDMSAEQAEVFIDCLSKWDGHVVSKKNGYVERRYTSAIQQNIDVVTAIACMHGIGFGIDNGITVTFKEKRQRTFGRLDSVKVTVEDVSCVSVPSGYILIRQNGRSSIVGNCMAGNLSVETCGQIFVRPSRQASSNYGVGSDGRIGLYVEEANRAWTSASPANDNRAVTIEVANDTLAPDYHVSDKAMDSLIRLVADICQRNGIKELIWSDNKYDRVNHVGGANMTWHRDFAATACPAPYLMSMHPYIAEEVNKILNPPQPTSVLKGTCQIPNPNGSGFLLGLEVTEDDGYTGEISIYDCTLRAWIAGTGVCGLTDNALWWTWNPQYGYYWTLFRVFKGDEVVAEQCYGFQNI